jgi:hypothetical protein
MNHAPATLHPTASQTIAPGRSPNSGHDKTATQIGNMFVSAITSEAGK